MCHRRQPLDCINHPAEYLQCTQLVPTGRLDCAVGYEYESWTSEGIVCEPACQCHSRSQWTCQSKCPLSLTASQYSWLAVVLRPLADRSTSRDIGVRSGTLLTPPTLNDGTITGVRDNIVTGILAVTPHPETRDSRRSDGISGHIQGHSSRGIVSEGRFRERGAIHSIRGRNAIQRQPTANNRDIWGTVFQSYKRSQSATTGVTTHTAFRCGHAQSRTSSVAGDSSGDCEC